MAKKCNTSVITFKICFFTISVICFSLQSLENFKKYLEGKTSITESDVPKDFEPLPSFSVCTEPPLDAEWLKTFNISANRFLYLSLLQNVAGSGEDSKLPTFLVENGKDGTTLTKLWQVSALEPQSYAIGSTIINTIDSLKNHTESDEVYSTEQINSPWYGACSNIVLKKPRHANEVLLTGFQYPR